MISFRLEKSLAALNEPELIAFKTFLNGVMDLELNTRWTISSGLLASMVGEAADEADGVGAGVGEVVVAGEAADTVDGLG